LGITALQALAPLIFIVILLALDALPKNIVDNPYNQFPQILNHPSKAFGSVAPCRVRPFLK
jgi:hypothetical protein